MTITPFSTATHSPSGSRSGPLTKENEMKRLISLLLVCLLALDSLAFARLGSDKTAYVGGTENQIKDGAEGRSSAKDEKNFVFEYKGGNLSIPYSQVDDLEYGQKAGRRIGLAIAISPWLLFSKKRKHFLTVGWKDEQDKQHAAVFELAARGRTTKNARA